MDTKPTETLTPLDGLRVLDLTDDSGRFATKLLAEMGASVVRIDPGVGVTHGSPMSGVDGRVALPGGVADWWWDAAKRSVDVDLDTEDGVAAYRRLALRADLIIETCTPGRLAALGVDHGQLVADNPRLVQVSLTPFGRTGPRAHWVTTDLVSSALGGILSVCGSPDQAVVPWGRQAFAAASSIAALSGLAAVRAARLSGRGQLVDVSVHEAVASSLEQVWFQYHYDDSLPFPKVAERQGSLHWSRAYVVMPCRTGWCMVTATPAPRALYEWLVAEDIPGASTFLEPGQELVAADSQRLVVIARELALRHDAAEVFHDAQSRHLAWGQVQTVGDLVTNEQLAFRGAFVSAADAAEVRRPRFPVVFSSTPSPTPPGPSTAPIAVIEAEWNAEQAATASTAEAPASAPSSKPLDGVRVLDLSWVLAGPFGCRLLGDLGADVMKVQTAARATTVNDPNYGFYSTFNRSKRSVALDMKADGAVAIMRRLVEESDVLIENFAAGVMARWGLDWATLHSWNPRLIYVSMSGCGHEGPWSSIVSYGPTIHALSGLTALSNPEGRGDIGVGYALNDMAVGSLAALTIVAALEARERTGEGQMLDIAQLEVGAYMVGSALMDFMTNGRNTLPAGNCDPYADFLFNNVLVSADGEVAVTVRHETDALALQGVIGGGVAELPMWCRERAAAEAAELLQAAGIPAGRVQNAHHMFTDDPQLAARSFFTTVDSAVFGVRPMERFPAVFSSSVLEPYRPAPAYLGEHAFDILGALGMSDDEVAEAMADGRLA